MRKILLLSPLLALFSLFTFNAFGENVKCDAGTYLPANASTCSQCQAGYYCPGGTLVESDSAQGLSACPNSYPTSDVGASNEYMCYRSGSDTCANLNDHSAPDYGTFTYANQSATYRQYYHPYWSGTKLLDDPTACRITNLNCTSPLTAEIRAENPSAPLKNYYYDGGRQHSNPYVRYRAINDNSSYNSGTDNYGSAPHTGLQLGEWERGWADGTKVHGVATCTDNYGRHGNAACHCGIDSYSIAGGSTVSFTDTEYHAWNEYDLNDCQADCAHECAHYVILYNRELFGYTDYSCVVDCDAGTYLPANSMTCTQCPAGSYCNGGSLNPREDYAVGIESCSDQTDGDYPNSVAGATSRNQCYSTSGTSTCASLNPVAHGTATYVNNSTVTYYNYYNRGLAPTPANECDILSLSCDSGYAVQPAGPFENMSYYLGETNLDPTNTKIRQLNGDDVLGNASNLSNGTAEIAWNNGAKIHFVASCAPTDMFSDEDFVSALSGASSTPELLELAWGENGVALRASNALDQGATGNECWIKIDGFTPANGAAQSIATPVWKFTIDGAFDEDEDEGLTPTQNCAAKCVMFGVQFILALSAEISKSFLGELAAAPYCKYQPLTCPAGTYLPANAADSSACTTCTAGNYCPGGGFSQSASVQGLSPCPQNTPNSAAGATSEGACYASVTCDAGAYLPMGQLSCAPCTNGNYCLGGTFNSNAVADQGLTACDNATPFSPTGSSAANACTSGVVCNAGMYLPANATECVSCPANSYCGGGVFGYTSTAQGITQCDSATPNSAANSTNANACYATITCAAGTYLPANSLTCTTCPVGNFCPGGEINSNSTAAVGLTPCSNGTPFSEQGASASNQCYANIICFQGTYLPANSLSCETCSANNYCLGGVFGYSSSVQGLTPCPQAAPYATAGATSENDCGVAQEVVCNPGNYLPANTLVCQPCTVGNYCNGGRFAQSAENQGIAACPTDSNYVTGTSAQGAMNDTDCYVATTVNCADYNPGISTNRTGVNRLHSTTPGKLYFDRNNADYSITAIDTIGACAITTVFCDSTKSLNSGYTGPLANYALFYTPVKGQKWRSLNDSASCNSTSSATLSQGGFEVIYADNTKITGDTSCLYNQKDDKYDCSCRLTGYAVGGGEKTPVTTAQQIKHGQNYGTESECQCRCPFACTNAFRDEMRWVDEFVPAFFGHLGKQLYCTDTVSIDWYNESTLVDSNTCTYKSSVTEPASNPTREGYTFNGWEIDNN